MTPDPTPPTPLPEVVTTGSSLALSEAPRCSCHGRHLVSPTCIWCGAPADPVAGAYLERLYPGQTVCRPCGRRQVHCECPHETVRARRGAPANAIPAPRTPVLRDVAPASEGELRAAWGDR